MAGCFYVEPEIKVSKVEGRPERHRLEMTASPFIGPLPPSNGLIRGRINVIVLG